MHGQTNINNQTSQAINENKITLSTLIASLCTHEKVNFLPNLNLILPCTVMLLLNSVTTLLNEKVVDKTVHPKEKVSNPPLEIKNGNYLDDEGKFKEDEFENNEKEKYSSLAHFSQRLQTNQKLNSNA
ncbi:hypothetical protein Pfo_002013 [Paulownia fortunei]|nr:hypothetical protein Pfo_002013 [Paulownia fortunei]